MYRNVPRLLLAAIFLVPAFAQKTVTMTIGSSQNPGYSCNVNGVPTTTFPLVSAALNIQNTVTIGSASSGAGAGKAKFEPLQITKNSDSCSLPLATALVTGAHFDAVIITFADAGKAILRVALYQVFVSDYQISQGSGSFTESFSLIFGGIVIRDPSVTPVTVTFGWSQLTNGPCPADVCFPIAGVTDN